MLPIDSTLTLLTQHVLLISTHSLRLSTIFVASVKMLPNFLGCYKVTYNLDWGLTTSFPSVICLYIWSPPCFNSPCPIWARAVMLQLPSCSAGFLLEPLFRFWASVPYELYWLLHNNDQQRQELSVINAQDKNPCHDPQRTNRRSYLCVSRGSQAWVCYSYSPI